MAIEQFGESDPVEPTPSPEQFLQQWDYSDDIGYGRPYSYWMKFAQAYADMVSKPLRDDNEHLKELLRCDPSDQIDDGFGSTWSRTCPTCGLGTMHVNRPGEVQCDYCG